MSNPRFYLVCAGMIAFIMLELAGVYWMQTGSPPSLAWVDRTVLGWGAAVALCGYMGITLWHS